MTGLARALDEVLFEPAGWFAIDAANVRVKGAVVTSLDAGLALVGAGPVATIVGRLRRRFVVVDVDLVGAVGDAAAEQVAGWCRRAGLWHLLRPSGGGHGRHHIYVDVADRHDDLAAFVATLRTSLNASPKLLDLRRAVRPLSAPHRLGHHTRPLGDLRRALRALRAPQGTDSAPSRVPARAGHATTAAVPLEPRSRRRRDLQPDWASYLATGIRPSIGGTDHKRSTYEAIATVQLLHAGYDATAAWAAISTAHPEAMTKAKDRGRTWWTRYVWNPAVESDLAFVSPVAVDGDVAADVVAARRRLPGIAAGLSPRRRPAFLLVAHHVLDRMERTSTRRVPAPERDLVLDTGIRDRKTIRAALRLLTAPAAAGQPSLAALHTETWTPAAKDSSSYEVELLAVAHAEPAATSGGGAVSQIPPPSFHTPLPHGLWSVLPRAAHGLWRELSTTPRTLEDLAAVGGPADDGASAGPSVSARRSTRSALTALGRSGLASCDVDGRWTLELSPTPEILVRAAAAHAELDAAMTAERRAYRAGTSSSWSTQRARTIKAQHARERAWWDGLEPAEQHARRDQGRAAFAQLDLAAQEQLKARLAARRIATGIDEPARHATWTREQEPDTYLARSLERRSWYDDLTPPQQHAYVASWQRHRDRFGIPTTPPRRSAMPRVPDDDSAGKQLAFPGLTSA